ncbi:MAG: PEP-CTERM sorting domain-containing protein [Armatimonadetes bacterium]|nr:PEP-CTERM sorting domain-containing protein [Armatimonadota bacterium]
MKVVWGRWVIAAALGLLLSAPSSAQADIQQNFSQLSSDSTPVSSLPAQVTYTVSGGQLRINIQDLSAYRIAQLYFNSDTTLTGLSFAAPVNPVWTISGTGASQNLAADGMGRFNWLVDFGSGTNRLAAGSSTMLFLNMTGTTSESPFANKYSVNPPGSVTALGVIKFEAGPGGDSAFGGSRSSVVPTPEPSSMLLFGAGALGLLRARRRKKDPARSETASV